MVQIKENFVTDSRGRKVGVVLKISDYNRVISELEELDDIRAFDAAKSSREDKIPFEEAVSQIERGRRK